MGTLIQTLKDKNLKTLFVGDGSVSFRKEFEESLGKKAYFVPIHLNNQLSSSVAKAALDRAQKNDFDDMDKLNPLYLKKSQAERMLDGEN